ncbi:MAG: class F sortase, partial [Candidatus Kerfeldbacteria bacterium]|nr:class F sortase [Candidatus Kerfeldbacteria bacterium]
MFIKPLKKVIVGAVIGALMFSPLSLAAQETLPTVRENVVRPITTPARIVISKIGVNAAVEPTGKDRNGVLGLPKAYNNIAWFKQSARPGKPGNALMWGHLNGAGGPAVLWNLKKLKVG